MSISACPSRELRIAWLVPLVSADRCELMATLAASSEDGLMRLPVDSRAIGVYMSRFTLEADAAALSAALFVAVARAILKVPNYWTPLHGP